jgi:hypothetical protein
MNNTFHFHGEKRFGKHTKRISITGILKNNAMDIGVARCSNRDMFNRKLGNVISTGRAIKNPEGVFIPTTDNVGKEFVEWCKEYCATPQE